MYLRSRTVHLLVTALLASVLPHKSSAGAARVLSTISGSPHPSVRHRLQGAATSSSRTAGVPPRPRAAMSASDTCDRLCEALDGGERCVADCTVHLVGRRVTDTPPCPALCSALCGQELEDDTNLWVCRQLLARGSCRCVARLTAVGGPEGSEPTQVESEHDEPHTLVDSGTEYTEETSQMSKNDSPHYIETENSSDTNMAKENNSSEEEVDYEHGYLSARERRGGLKPFLGKREEDGEKPLALRRSALKPFLGKRGGLKPFLGKRGSSKPFLGKRTGLKPFLGKRSGNPLPGVRTVSKPFLGKRGLKPFLGKRDAL